MKPFLTIFAIVVSLLIAEVFSNIFYRSPYRSTPRRLTIPHYVPDAQLGWKNRPGKYVIDFVDQGNSRTIPVRIGSMGERLSYSNSSLNPNVDILFVGDSWTFGEAVKGEEAFPGLIAKQNPNLNVVNAGIGGHSTYQTLLFLESFDWQRYHPRFVYYGLLSFHEERNIALNGWLRSLSKSSQGADTRLPYVRLNTEGGISRMTPTTLNYSEGVCRRSSLACLFIQSYWRVADHWLDQQKVPVTVELLKMMGAVAAKHGSKLVVALLDPRSHHYEKKLRNLGIENVSINGDSTRLTYDAHPDLLFHARVAQNIHANYTSHKLIKPLSPPEL